jgi:hypothetical protein
MSSPLAIREAVAAYLPTAITGLRAGTDPGTIANPPVALVLPAQGTYIDYTVALNPHLYDVRIRVVILISRASERAGFELLDQYLEPYGASSIVAAILANPTMSGACDYVVPQQASGPGAISFAGIDYWGAEIICTVGAE